MIKNRTLLESTLARSTLALDMIECGLDAANPENFVSDWLANMQGRRIHIIAYGKAAYSMAHAASKHLKIAGGIIVSPKGSGTVNVPNMHTYYASHPIPDSTCSIAARAIQRYLAKLGCTETVLFLISGGGSSLLFLPPKMISYSDAADATRLLLESGAKISAINCIRRHISQVAGGRLVSAIKCKAVALIISDVQANRIYDISSGCTANDPTTYKQALNHIHKLGLQSQMPNSVMQHLLSGTSDVVRPCTRITNHVIAKGATCAKAISKMAKDNGLLVQTIPIYDTVQKESERIVQRTRPDTDSCIIFYGEPTVKVCGSGKGGRNQELVLRLLSLYRKARIRCIITSFGTDGIDGNTKYAGAIANSAQSCNMRDIQNYLNNNDSNSFFAKHGGLLLTGHTHRNLADVGFVIVRKSWQAPLQHS